MKPVKKYAYFFLAFVSALLIVTTLLSTLYNNTSLWWLRSLNFPREQLFILAILFLLLLLPVVHKWSLINKLLTLGLIASAIIHAWFILPYTLLFAKEVPTVAAADVQPEDQLFLLIANVYMKNRNADGLLQMIQQKSPHIVFLVETNQWWQQAMQPLRKIYPYALEYPLDNTYGLLLYSKYKLVSPEIKFLEKATIPSVHTKVEMPNSKLFIFHGEHPVPPVPSKYPDNVGEDRGELKKVAALVRQEKLPAIVAGDLNDVSWSKTSRVFQKDSELSDVRTGRHFYNSFDATSYIFRWPLDHVFVDKKFKLIQTETLQSFGADHFPFYTQLVLAD